MTLPLDLWRAEIGYHPWTFWGWANAELLPPGFDTDGGSRCNSLVKKYSWQAVDAAGREDIQSAIDTAVERLVEQLRYAPAPRFVERTLRWPKYYDASMERVGYAQSDGRWVNVALPEGLLIGVGVEEITEYDDAAAVTYSDLDGDGLDETWTAQYVIVGDLPDASEVVCYFSAADRFTGGDASAQWRVEPIEVRLTPGLIEVRGKAWLMAKPVLYEGVSPQGLDPTDPANRVSTIGIYRRRLNPNGITEALAQAVLTWESAPGCACVPATNGSGDPSAVTTAIARLSLRDKKLGRVGVSKSIYNASAGTWSAVSCGECRAPDSITVRYLAGADWERAHGAQLDAATGVFQMQKKWRTVVARLAAAEMMRRVSSCNAANRELYRWQMDMSRANGLPQEQFAIAPDDLANPLGTFAGQVYAWKVIRSARQVIGVAA